MRGYALHRYIKPAAAVMAAIAVTISLAHCSRENAGYIHLEKGWMYARPGTGTLDFKPVTDLAHVADLLPERRGIIILKNDFYFAPEICTGPVAVLAGRILWADETRLNGVFLGKTGRFPPDPANYYNIIRRYKVPPQVLRENDTNSLVITMYVDAEGGIADTPLVGDADELEYIGAIRHFFHVTLNVFVFLLLITVAANHFLMYWKRRESRENLYYVCALLTYAVTSINYFIWAIPSLPDISYIIWNKIVWANLFLFLYFITLFTNEFLQRPKPKWLMRAMVVVTALPIAATMAMGDYRMFFDVRSKTVLFMPFYIILLLYFIISALHDKVKEAKPMAAVIAIPIIFGLSDIVAVLLKINTGVYITGYGLPFFLIGVTFALTNKFMNLYLEISRINKAYEEAEAKYRGIFNNIDRGIFQTNPEGVPITANPALARIMGYPSAEDLLNSKDSRAVDLYVDPAARDTMIAMVLNEGAVRNFETRLRRNDGSIIDVSITSHVIRDEVGKVQYIEGMLEDISEKKRLAEILSASEQMFRDLSEKSLVGVYIIQKGVFRYVNPRFADIFGYIQEELLGTEIGQCVYREDIALVLEKVSGRAIGDADALHYEFRGVRRDGDVINVEVYDSPSLYQGSPAVLGTLLDVTERRRSELLRLEKDAAEAASRAKSEFLANMSHELRTPMNPIIGLTHLLQQSSLTVKQRDYVDKIHDSAQLLLGIINDVLDFSKIEAGKLEIEQVDFNLEVILQNLANMFSRTAESKGLELLFRIESDVPRLLKGDPLRMQQVLINLLGNALKFTETGNVLLAIRRDRAGGVGREFLRVSVADTGIGMSQEQQEKLFKSFSQADTSITRRFGGTGLGLAICKRLVELMGGDITVESFLNAGSIFTFTMPLEPGVRGEESDGENRESLRNLKALIVDDNEVSLEILESYCRSLGIRTDCVASGEAAIDLIRASVSDPFDLLLIDWKMPGMDGLETINRIRNLTGKGRSLPVVMSSAYSLDEIAQKGEESGIQGFLPKPVSLSMLGNVLVEALEGRVASSWKSSPVADAAIMAPYAGRNILLVEDNLINQQVATEILKNAGLSVVTAGNGREAISLLKEHDFDLVLMDLQMPEMDGFEATRSIRLMDAYQGLPIVAMTAHAMVGDRERCLAAGMNDHTPKPIEPSVLFRTLARWLKRSTEPPAVERTSSDEDDGFPSLPGIDMAAGLKRVAGNRSLFRKIVLEFCTTFRDTREELDRLLRELDYAAAARLVHSIKGTGGNIGAMELHGAAFQLEEVLASRDTASIPRAAERFGQKLDEVLGNIDILDRRKHADDAIQPLDKTYMRKIALRLKSDLEKSSFDAEMSFRELADAGAMNFAAEYRELEKHVESFDFTMALEALETLMHRLEGNDPDKDAT